VSLLLPQVAAEHPLRSALIQAFQEGIHQANQALDF